MRARVEGDEEKRLRMRIGRRRRGEVEWLRERRRGAGERLRARRGEEDERKGGRETKRRC